MESAAADAPRAVHRVTLGDRLEQTRRRRFVGREAELEAFTSALPPLAAPFAVLHVHGPGGIGKTALLRRYAEEARARGVVVVSLEASQCTPTPAGLMDGLCRTMGLPEDACPVDRLAEGGPAVLLVDGYDRVLPADDWVREELLPILPPDVLVVLASRLPPSDAWRTDAAWSGLMRVLALASLPTAECRAFLAGSNISGRLHDELTASSHGHPLALSLLADAVERRGAAATSGLADDLDLVRVLLDRLVPAVPDEPHREALYVCSLVRTLTESLLRDALKTEDVGGLFRWLRGLPFVEEGPSGLDMHNLARDLLDTDLRWRDPQRHRRLLRRLLRIIGRAIPATGGIVRDRLIIDLLYLHRTSPALSQCFTWTAPATDARSVRAEPLRTDDRTGVLAMTRRHEGSISARWAAFWLDRQPSAFTAFRVGGELAGYCCYLRLHEAEASDREADPGTRAAWAYIQRNGPPREAEHVTMMRFVMDAESYQRASPAFDMRVTVIGRNCFGTPALSWDLIAVLDPYAYPDELDYIDYQRAPGADFRVDGRCFAVYARDWRRRPLAEWGRIMEQRGALREVPGSDATTPRPARVLPKAEFDEAVRSALRNLARPAALAASPLLDAQLIRRTGSATPASLATTVRTAVETLRADPRDEKLYRVLERTYLRRAETQELAAEALDLPFSTYRRHLAQGVAAVVGRLWHDEVYGEELTAG